MSDQSYTEATRARGLEAILTALTTKGQDPYLTYERQDGSTFNAPSIETLVAVLEARRKLSEKKSERRD